MRFSEDGICELDSITSVDECEAYKDFLIDERHRHAKELDNAKYQATLFGKGISTYHQATAVFYDSAATRHRQDLDGITKRIKEIEAHRATLEVK